MTVRTAIGGSVATTVGITYLTFAVAITAFPGVQPTPGGLRAAMVPVLVTGAGLVLAITGRRFLAESRGARRPYLTSPRPERPEHPEPPSAGVCRNTPPPDPDF